MTGNLKSLANLPVNPSTCLLIPPTRKSIISELIEHPYKLFNSSTIQPFLKLGCGSEEQKENFLIFFLLFSHLALTLSPETN